MGIARSLAVIAAENCVDSPELVEYLLYVALTNVNLPSSDEVRWSSKPICVLDDNCRWTMLQRAAAEANHDFLIPL